MAMASHEYCRVKPKATIGLREMYLYEAMVRQNIPKIERGWGLKRYL
jgi:hypothetical protein